jgi:hypothetical protein
VRSASRIAGVLDNRLIDYGFRFARDQTAGQGEAGVGSVTSPSAPEASDVGEVKQPLGNGIGQVLHDLWKKIKPK